MVCVQSRLLRDYGDLFSEAEGVISLGDLQGQIDAIREYGDALEELKSRGVSDSLLSEITDMDVSDAVAYTNELLSLTDEQYEQYMALWEEKQAAAQEVAQKFYQDELAALESEFVNKIPESLSELKDGLYQVGVNSAQGLAQGLQSMASSVQASAVNIVEHALTAAKQAMGVHSPSTVWADFGGNLAAGLGVGFNEQMSDVSAQITRSIPMGGAAIVSSATGASSTGTSSRPIELSFSLSTELDGQTLARRQYKYVARENNLRGGSLVEVGVG